MSLQIIQEVVELLIEKAVQEELCAKFQTIMRGQFQISLETILWDQWSGGLYLRKGNHTPHASAIGTRSTFHNVHPCHCQAGCNHSLVTILSSCHELSSYSVKSKE